MSTVKESEIRFIKCKKCGHEYYETWNHCPNCRTPNGTGSVRPVFWALLLIAIALFCYFNPFHLFEQNLVSANQEQNESVSDFNSDQVDFEDAENQLVQVQTPATGIYKNYSNSELVATFEIRNHTDDYNYLMKFNDYNTGSTVFSVFLNKGEDCSIMVPLGDYIISFAQGREWYGDEDLFGGSTQYMKYDKLISFYRQGQYVQGNYIDMTPTANGNLDTDYISEDEF